MEDVYLSILKRYWGYDGFRGIQHQIIESIGSGRDTLGLMPTGGGKSVTFQVPALSREGLCIVVTPLVALMKDQVRALRSKGIKAAALSAAQSPAEILVTLDNCIFGAYKFLYVSPERLSSDLFLDKVRRMHVSLLTVDEAHCISQWGYDFRPSYARIAELRKILPGVPVLALTATATPRVADDICRQLAFMDGNVFRMSFYRKNLAYVVRYTEDKTGELIHILNCTEGSAIVYVRSRKNARETAGTLQTAGMSATFYHAGLDTAERDSRQRQWMEGKVRVMVATNAFGMGIDKPDVRLVVHVDIPNSIEAYFQEAGRAGRDGGRAYAVLLYQKIDRMRLTRRIAETYPDKDAIRKVYEHICYYFQMAMGDGYNVTRDFDMDEFCRNYKHFPVQTESALKLLERAGYIKYEEEPDSTSRLHFLLRRDELYRIHETEARQEQLIQCVLRNYGGLFSDYVFIDERHIAALTGMTPDEVYDGLTTLGKSGILHYIPRKKMPRITFSCRRVEKERIVLPPSVYDDRKQDFKERIEAMLSYAEGTDVCRSEALLRYFGEEDTHPCGQCDICRRRESSRHVDAADGQVVSLILEILKDGRKHGLSEMTFPGVPREKTARLLHQMIEEEAIRVQDGRLYLPRR